MTSCLCLLICQLCSVDFLLLLLITHMEDNEHQMKWVWNNSIRIIFGESETAKRIHAMQIDAYIDAHFQCLYMLVRVTIVAVHIQCLMPDETMRISMQ